jgi:hypothetical protein
MGKKVVQAYFKALPEFVLKNIHARTPTLSFILRAETYNVLAIVQLLKRILPFFGM